MLVFPPGPDCSREKGDSELVDDLCINISLDQKQTISKTSTKKTSTTLDTPPTPILTSEASKSEEEKPIQVVLPRPSRFSAPKPSSSSSSSSKATGSPVSSGSKSHRRRRKYLKGSKLAANHLYDLDNAKSDDEDCPRFSYSVSYFTWAVSSSEEESDDDDDDDDKDNCHHDDHDTRQKSLKNSSSDCPSITLPLSNLRLGRSSRNGKKTGRDKRK